MKLVIIYPDILKGANWSGYYYTGIGYLSAFARREGHEVSLMHLTQPPGRHEFLSDLKGRLSLDGPTLIGFSSTTNMFSFVRLWSSWIKAEYDHFILVGGVHATLNPEETINIEHFDAICIGEGEAPLVELLEGIQRGEDITSINNIWIKHDGKVYKNPVRPIIKDLDTLPFPDREIFDYNNLDREKEGIGVFMASRGCPYDCYYCCNHAIKTCTGGAKGYVRFRSVDNVLDEIKAIHENYPFIKFLHFDDDILPINKKWFKNFSNRYSKEVGLPFECNVRPNIINEDIIELLSNAGCKTLRLGLESGNSFIRKNVLNRDLSEATIVKASSLCKEAGIRLYTFNMVGLPFEDMSARLDTIKFNVRIKSDEEQVSIFYPYDKTRLFEVCKEQGLLSKKELINPLKDTTLLVKMGERNRIVFTAYYFTLLVRLYRIFLRLPPSISRTAVRISDSVLCSRIAAWTLYPPLITFMRFLGRHRRLETWARKLKHEILKKG